MTDIYEDLEHFDFSEELEKIKNEKTKLQERILHLEKENATLTKKCESLESKLNTVNENISSLLKTSKAEIERKDKTVLDLRRQLDDFAFRRQNKIVPNVLGRLNDINDKSKTETQVDNKIQNVPPTVRDDSNKPGSVITEIEKKVESSQLLNVRDSNSNDSSSTMSLGLQLFNPFPCDKIEERRIRLTQIEFEKDYLEVETMMSTERQPHKEIQSPRVSKRSISPVGRQSNTFDVKLFKHRDSRSPDKPYRDHRRSPRNSFGEHKKRTPHRRKSRSPIRKHSRSGHRRRSKSPLRRQTSPSRRQTSPGRWRSRSPHRKHSRSPYRNTQRVRIPQPNRSRSPPGRKFHNVHSRRSPYEKYSTNSRVNQKEQVRTMNGSNHCAGGRSLDLPEESYCSKDSTKYVKIKHDSDAKHIDVHQVSNNERSEDVHQLEREGKGDKNDELKQADEDFVDRKNCSDLYDQNNCTVPEIEDGEIDSENEVSLGSNKHKSNKDSQEKSDENKKLLDLNNSTTSSTSRVFVKKKKAKLEFSFTDDSVSQDVSVPTESKKKPHNEEQNKISLSTNNTNILKKGDEVEKSLENKKNAIETDIKDCSVITNLEHKADSRCKERPDGNVNKPLKVNMESQDSKNKNTDENKEPVNKVNTSGGDKVQRGGIDKKTDIELNKQVGGDEESGNVVHMKVVRRKTIIRK